MKQLVSAISVGKLQGTPLLDLCYVEDRDAEVDMNVVMTERGEYVEVQGSGEEAVFTAEEMAQMIRTAFEDAGGGDEKILYCIPFEYEGQDL